MWPAAIAIRAPPSPDVVELGFPPLMLTLAGAEPLPPSLGSGRDPPVLEFPPRLPGPLADLLLQEPLAMLAELERRMGPQ